MDDLEKIKKMFIKNWRKKLNLLKEMEKLKLQIEALDSRRQKRLTTPKFILENNSSTNSINSNSIATDPSTNQEIEITSTSSSNSNPPINYNINDIIASKFPELTNNIVFGRITGFQQDLNISRRSWKEIEKSKGRIFNSLYF